MISILLFALGFLSGVILVLIIASVYYYKTQKAIRKKSGQLTNEELSSLTQFIIEDVSAKQNELLKNEVNV